MIILIVSPYNIPLNVEPIVWLEKSRYLANRFTFEKCPFHENDNLDYFWQNSKDSINQSGFIVQYLEHISI
jgi:hypothetical protein